MKRIAIIHFSPLELYPPIQNFLNYLAKADPAVSISVFTTDTTFTSLEQFGEPSPNIRIYRLGTSGKSIPVLKRYLNYVIFYIGCLWYLIIKRPSRVLYFETISSWPAYLYKNYFNKKARILVHYHEYTSPAEYTSGMKLTRYFHKLEKYFYPSVEWLSHTNDYRMDKFVTDIEPIVVENRHILPNYPSLDWCHETTGMIGMPVKVVFAGSLGMDTMYTKEFAEWVIAQNGNVIWDIYAYNVTDDAKAFMAALNSQHIRFMNGVNYKELPAILKEYNVGVIIYKGHTENIIYSAPNKLFEYLACGLDVWFPHKMEGTTEYITKDIYPKVIAIDFNKLEDLELESAVNRKGFTYRQPVFFAEHVLAPISRQLLA